MTAASKSFELPGKPPEMLDESLRAAIEELERASSVASQLLVGAPVQLLVLDRQLHVRWVNARFAEAREVTPAAPIGAHASQYLGDLTPFRLHFDSAFAGERMHFVMRTTAHHAMSELNVDLRPIKNAAGMVSGVCAYLDASGQHQEDQGIPNTGPALRQILGSLPSFVFVLDRDMKIAFANREVRGRPVEALEGMHVTSVFPKPLHPLALTTLHRVLATGQVDAFSARLDTDEAQPRHFDFHVTPIRRNGKTIVALSLVATETTEQIRAERAIATQARMIESMLEGVAVINEDGVVEITNPAFDAMFGYGRGQLIGREMAELAEGAFGHNERWLSQGSSGSLHLEFDARRRDGATFAVAGVLSRFEVAGRNHSLVVLQDVSERKQLERAILQAVNREQHRIGNDLHDGLGQELTGIALMLRGVAGRLTTEYPAILPEVESITRLVSNAIENTRALARGLSPVGLERGGLQDALNGLAMHAMELYGVQVVFSHRLQGKPLSVELQNHLYRIAQEAVRNAVKHGQARTIRLHLTTARAKVKLAITDDGTGLPEGAMDATGMGLKIMRYRARMLGGEVQFERVEPNGTRIVCECPIEAHDAQTRPTATKRAKKTVRKAART